MQPRQGGHRAGMDALVLAAAVPSGFDGRVADCGSGSGAVGLAVLSRCPGATAILIERSAEMTAFAQQSLALTVNAALAGRASLLTADVALAGAQRTRAGLENRSADFVLMNPPFNDPRDRATPHSLRSDAHVAGQTVFEDWLRSAAAMARTRGRVALIARPESIDTILAALAGRFGGVEIVPVHSVCDQPAIRIVVRAARGSRARMVLCPPLILHEGDERRFTERAQAINAGTASLFGD